MELMKALVLEEFGSMVVNQVPRRQVGPDEVEIAVTHTGICGSDIHGFTGENGRRFPGQVMGHETEGRIVRLGADVRSAPLAIGARVTFNPVILPREDVDTYLGREQHSPNKYVVGVRADVTAGLAQYVCVPARNVVLIPDELPEGVGALIEPLAVAVHATIRAGISAGQRVLVIGGGPIGQSLVLALKMSGVEQILVSEINSARRDLIEQLGASTVDPTGNAAAVSCAVEEFLGGFADVAFDAVGIASTLGQAVAGVKLGGVVCLVGMGSPRVELDAYAISTGERSIVGSFTYSAEDFRTASRWVARLPQGVERLVSRIIAPEQAPAEFRLLARGEGPAGKVLVQFGDPAGTDKAGQE